MKIFQTKVPVLAALCMMMLSGLFSTKVYAYDFEVNGIYYNKIGESEVEVTRNSDCKYYGDIVIPSSVNYGGVNYSVTSIGESAFSDCSALTSVEIPDSVTSIGHSAFMLCRSLTSVKIPDSVTLIEPYAFFSCTSLTTIEIPRYVSSIGGFAFNNCSSLTSIEIPDAVMSIGGFAFQYCSSLTSIKISNSIISIDLYTFSGCRSLTSIKIPDYVMSIGSYAFSDCRKLTSVEIPNSVTSIGNFAFSDCRSLTSIEIPNSVTSIGTNAFDDCSSLTSIEIPNSVTSIGSNTFYGCSSLTSIEIPNSVTSIENCAFMLCSSLTSIEIPNSVTSIGYSAFDYCSSLTAVTLLASTPPELGSIVFYATPSSKTLYVPKSSLEAYRSSPWTNEFADIQPTLPNGLTIETEGSGKVYIGGEEVVSGTKYETGSLNMLILADDGYEIASATIGDENVENQIINHILTIDDCEDAGTLKVVFAPENEASLTVMGHESHTLTHYYKEGTQARIDLSPSEGWELYSLTFNGEDVKGDVAGNTYTTPALSGANSLDVVMKGVATDAEQIGMPRRNITFRRYGNTVEILNLEEGEPISIYSAEGVCEYQGEGHTVTLSANGVYILRTQSEVLKFAL